MQAAGLRGERLLIVEDEPLIAIDLQATLEREGARVLVARTMPEALRRAEYPALSAGVLDFRLGEHDAELICETLNRHEVPFIFFTGLAGRLSRRWAATPVVPKPANPAEIIGALKFVLSPDTRNIIVRSQRGEEDHNGLARIDHVISGAYAYISEAEERIVRMRHCIARLTSSGADTSAAERVLATTIELVEGLRKHRHISAQLASQ